MYQSLSILQLSKSLISYGNNAQTFFYSGYLFSKFKLTQIQELAKIISLLQKFRKLQINQQQSTSVLEKLMNANVEKYEVNQVKLMLGKFICECIPQFGKCYQTKKEIRVVERKDSLKTRKLSSKQCSICYQTIDLKQMTVLGCSHEFHKHCVSKVIEARIDIAQLPVLCPSQGCRKQVSSKYVNQLVSNQYIRKYDKITLRKLVEDNYQSMCWCPTVGCEFVFCFEPKQTTLKCPLCFKTYCLNCHVEYHEGITCSEYQKIHKISQHDQKFYEFASGAKYKQCPKCQYWVQKSQGCDHMTCRCKFQFCYTCGEDYNSCNCNQEQLAQRAQIALAIAAQQLRQLGQAVRQRQLYLQALQMLQMLQLSQEIRRQGYQLIQDGQILFNNSNGTNQTIQQLQPNLSKNQFLTNNPSNSFNQSINCNTSHSIPPRKIFKPFDQVSSFDKDQNQIPNTYKMIQASVIRKFSFNQSKNHSNR